MTAGRSWAGSGRTTGRRSSRRSRKRCADDRGRRRAGACPVHPLPAAEARPPAQHRAAAADPDALHQHDLAPSRSRRSRATRGWSCASGGWSAGTRWRWSCARTTPTPASAATWPPTPRAASLYEVGFNHFFRGKDARRHGRPGLLPGPRGAGHLCPRLPRGPAQRGPARPLPARGRARPGAVELSASAPHARLLGVPDGVDGPRPAGGHLPGPIQSLPPRPRHQGHQPAARVGLPRRR